MSLLARSLIALLVAVTANANQPCDTQDSGVNCGEGKWRKFPLPPVTFASPGGTWEATPEILSETCKQHGFEPAYGVRIKACNNNQSLEYPDISNEFVRLMNITCAEDHPCPDGVTVHVTLCC